MPVTVLALCVAVSANADGLSIGAAKARADGERVLLQAKAVTTGKTDLRVGPYPHFAAGVQSGTVQSSSITEASGIAASRKNAGVLWVHNDSGDSARVFAMSTAGKHLGIYNLSGVTALDWEDMAVGPGPIPGQDYLYMGDIGDNNAGRSDIVVYRVAEPTVSVNQQPVTTSLIGVETLRLRYEDGPRDAETLMVDPVTRDVYIVSKRESQSRVYRVAASELTTTGTAVLRYKAQLPWGWATGGDISPRGDEIIIRGYGNASVWSRPPGSNLWDAFKGVEHTVALVSEPQGEAIGYAADGQGYYTVSEGASRPIYIFARQADPGPECFYIEEPDRSAGMRVSTAPSTVAGLDRGSSVDVDGLLSTLASGERSLADALVSLAAQPVSLAPVGVSARGLDPGPDSTGLLVRLWGRITQIDPSGTYLYIDDGSSLADGTLTSGAGNLGVRVEMDGRAYNAGQHLSMAGVVSCFRATDGPAKPMLRVRSAEDMRAM